MQINETAVNQKIHILYLKLYIYIVQKVIIGGGSFITNPRLSYPGLITWGASGGRRKDYKNPLAHCIQVSWIDRTRR